MSVAIGQLIRDPVLYRAISFAGWLATETEDESRLRLQRLEAILRQHGWMPPEAGLPGRYEMAWHTDKPWDDWSERPGWEIHRFAKWNHEEVIVFLGVLGAPNHKEQEAGKRALEIPASDQENWIRGAREAWNTLIGPRDWEQSFDLPDAAQPGGRPLVLGHGWVWAGEWELPPEEGWEAFGQKHYRDRGWSIVFDWGLLVYYDSEGGRPRFDVHTTVDTRADRDQFMVRCLPGVLMSFFKSTQFYKTQYQMVLGPRLDQRERAVSRHIEPRTDRSLAPSGQDVVRLSTELYHFSRDIAKLKDDAHSLELAKNDIVQLLSSHGAHVAPGTRPLLDDSIDRLGRQLRSDLEYYRTTETLGLRALETDRILAQIENTKTATRLTIIGILLGMFLGFGRLLPETMNPWFRLAISLGSGIIFSILYWVWSLSKWGPGPIRAKTYGKDGR